MTEVEFKNFLDSKIVEYLNARVLPVDDRWLKHENYKPWKDDFWKKYIDVYYLKKINMILADCNFFNDCGLLYPDFALRDNYVEDSEVNDSWFNNPFSNPFNDLFFECFVVNTNDTDCDEIGVYGHVKVDLEKITDFFKYCSEELKGMHYDKDPEDYSETDFDSLQDKLVNKRVDDNGFFIDYNTLDDCEENGYIDFSGDEWDFGVVDISKTYCAMKYYFSKYVWTSLEGERINYLKLLAQNNQISEI